jgi:hypothetical protein
MILLRTISVDFDLIDEILIGYSAFVIIGWREIGGTIGQYASYLQILGKSMTQSGKKCRTMFWLNMICHWN